MSGVKGKTGRLAGNDARDFSLLIKKSYNYLYYNFSKFTPERKYHLSLEIIKKAMPTHVENKGDPLIKNYVQIYTPEIYSREEVEASSRATDRSV